MHLPRAIRTHECTEADKLLQIHAGPSGPGGAPVFYQITMPNIVDDRVLGSASVMLSFQHGPTCENGLNGITIESLLAVARDRLEQFQKGPFACRENDSALNSIRIAMDALHHRTRRRQREHAEGTSLADAMSPGEKSTREHYTDDEIEQTVDTIIRKADELDAEAPSPLAGEGRGEGSKQEPGAQAPGTSSDLSLRRTVSALLRLVNALAGTQRGDAKLDAAIDLAYEVLMEAHEAGITPAPIEKSDAIGDRLTLRPSVAAFAQEMKRTLRKHDEHKGGQPAWRGLRTKELLRGAELELREASDELDKDHYSDAADEFIDTANYCMMGWDVALRKATDPDPRADQPAEGGAS